MSPSYGFPYEKRFGGLVTRLWTQYLTNLNIYSIDSVISCELLIMSLDLSNSHFFISWSPDVCPLLLSVDITVQIITEFETFLAIISMNFESKLSKNYLKNCYQNIFYILFLNSNQWRSYTKSYVIFYYI